MTTGIFWSLWNPLSLEYLKWRTVWRDCLRNRLWRPICRLIALVALEDVRLTGGCRENWLMVSEFMIKKRRKSFERAHCLLEELRSVRAAMGDGTLLTRATLQPLWQLQRLLVKEIPRAERKVRRIKAILRSKSEEEAADKVSSLLTQIEGYRHLTYMWRSFGDAVAFLFMDKFALKQVFYNTQNRNVKQDAGFLSDKSGFAGEWKEVERWIRQGVPALLSDLTNTIRHGDVCVMTGPDPVLIEVKLGKLDGRGREQRDSIRKLTEFFDTDEATGLRGLGEIRRMVHQSPEVNYAGAMEVTIIAALNTGAAASSPECGLWYLAVADEKIDINASIEGLGLLTRLSCYHFEISARFSGSSGAMSWRSWFTTLRSW
jgi:hypothetical protein